MRYANEARHLLPQGSTTRTLPQEYHTIKLYHRSTTRSLPQDGTTCSCYYMTSVCTTRARAVPHSCYHRTVPHACYHRTVPHDITTGQTTTLVTTVPHRICVV